ncbi:hypothetical protein HDR60_03135 [bacterium]|nr:hypothetical protein [bacterium]
MENMEKNFKEIIAKHMNEYGQKYTNHDLLFRIKNDFRSVKLFRCFGYKQEDREKIFEYYRELTDFIMIYAPDGCCSGTCDEDACWEDDWPFTRAWVDACLDGTPFERGFGQRLLDDIFYKGEHSSPMKDSYENKMKMLRKKWGPESEGYKPDMFLKKLVEFYWKDMPHDFKVLTDMYLFNGKMSIDRSENAWKNWVFGGTPWEDIDFGH